MLYDKILEGQKIKLRMVELSDCNQDYYNWLNDSEVNQYLETRWNEQSIVSIRESSHSYLFAIIFNNKHIGNIKIGPINSVHRFADISYFIGDKSAWGQGVATEAIKLVCDFGFKILKLNKLCAGAYAGNIGSCKALQKNKFQPEAIYRKQYLLGSAETLAGDGGQIFSDAYKYGLLASEYEKE